MSLKIQWQLVDAFQRGGKGRIVIEQPPLASKRARANTFAVNFVLVHECFSDGHIGNRDGEISDVITLSTGGSKNQ
ncbi:hypothetical protein D5039_19260 [Verminephrobacter aporrectodeae subsp. tuberculatae]|uniref:Uncharacterized protein n=1 Tax=Verminephrobacter aporrectodeae subsp. tuberculatae TaxID=1110392 RepID=A0ABT3KXZ0_9BURK|nr:hypothetical protein [Verminephrobacter aporrectodeae subsp. tuberculatae]